MTGGWTIGAQLSTSHSPTEKLDLDKMVDVVGRVHAEIGLDLLVVGSREVPDIFRGFCDRSRATGQEIFLWYNVLSDIEGMEDGDLVVDWRGERSSGWGGWAEQQAGVSETFRFVCPNNPAPRNKTLGRLEELLERYAFDGVFLDKIRFPSPANGFDELVSCFCDHCCRAARAVDLDLEAVARLFESRAIRVDGPAASRHGGMWLEDLLAANPLLQRFHRFRVESITSLAGEAHGIVARHRRKTSFDLFSPGLAQLVGQDYRALSRYCSWAKPMTYRVAKGPAGLRLEIPALVEGVARHFTLTEESIAGWAAAHITGFADDTLSVTRNSAVPLSLITEEIAAATDEMRPAPVYFGLELVRHPGVIDITPDLVRDMVGAGRSAGAAGLVISWDLLHAPPDGVAALAAAVREG